MWLIVVNRNERKTGLPPLVYGEIKEEKALQRYDQMRGYGYPLVFLAEVVKVERARR